MQRATIPALEAILGQPFNVLDKGKVCLIEYMGSDETIVNAARVSYGKGTKVLRDDHALINYLLRNKHTSPFEMCEIVLYIKLPIFIAAQWIRHRTANINAHSARYSLMEDEFYIPNINQLKTQSVVNKQCSGQVLEADIAEQLSKQIEEHSAQSYQLYTKMLEQGLSRELARMILPQNIYTQWYWKIDLHNLLHFLKLRLHPHAQYEIREYAKVILENIVKPWVPAVYQAFVEHSLNSINLSRNGQQIVKDFAQQNLQSKEHYGVGKGEWLELMNMLD